MKSALKQKLTEIMQRSGQKSEALSPLSLEDLAHVVAAAGDKTAVKAAVKAASEDWRQNNAPKNRKKGR